MSYLYIGTFGSFLGYSSSFPLLIAAAAWFAALGPITGSLIRPVGGWLSDLYGGAHVTFWNFVAMALTVVAVLLFLALHSFVGFFAAFVVLFFTAGVGNGSTYRMIPVIFRTEREREVEGQGADVLAEGRRLGLKEGAFALGFIGAVAAYGGFIIPRAFGSSVGTTGGPQAAFIAFIAFYVRCVVLTWYYYHRKSAEMPC